MSEKLPRMSAKVEETEIKSEENESTRLQTTQQMKKMYEEEAGNGLQLRKVSDEGSDKLPDRKSVV